MKEVAISEFKAKCLALVDEVQKTKTPLLITKFGRPVAEVIPPTPKPAGDWIGSMRDRIEILGDIVAPATDPEEWEVLRD
jgi:prevent-host-death family protein